MRAIYGLYPDPDSAQRAVEVLQDAERALGFKEKQIVVLSGEPYEDHPFGQRDKKTIMPWIAAAGGLVGGLLGFWFISFTQKAYPLITGGMQIVTKWPDGIITYELTMLGAILSTVATLLITARIPDWRRHVFDPGVGEGKILIGVVNAPESCQDEIRRRLCSAGAGDVKEFAG
jgi:hypothetical protein